MILRPCQGCTLETNNPERIQPAEARLAVHCTHDPAHTAELLLCPVHAVELKGWEVDGSLHCGDCHKHPLHRCSPAVVDSEESLT